MPLLFQGLVRVVPHFDYNKDGSFDLDLEVTLDPSLELQPFPMCLPERVSAWGKAEGSRVSAGGGYVSWNSPE